MKIDMQDISKSSDNEDDKFLEVRREIYDIFSNHKLPLSEAFSILGVLMTEIVMEKNKRGK